MRRDTSILSLLLACLFLSRALSSHPDAQPPPHPMPRPPPTSIPCVWWEGCSTASTPPGILASTTASVAASVTASTSSTQTSNPAQSSPNLASQYAKGISAGTVNISNPDPCGPPVQSSGAAPGSGSTCAANVSVADITQSSAYGVQCYDIGAGWELEADTCSDAAMTVCIQISGQWGNGYQDTNKWIWTTQQGNCTFGYWLPEGGAPPPSYERCYEQIISPMHGACGEPKFNAGSVNIRVMPSYAGGKLSTGMAVDGNYPSYAMVPQKSYCGVNSEDLC